MVLALDSLFVISLMEEEDFVCSNTRGYLMNIIIYGVYCVQNLTQYKRTESKVWTRIIILSKMKGTIIWQG